MILKNCWRNRRRTLLTILSIGVSLCLMGVLLSIYQAFFYANPAPGEALRLITRNSISLAQPLPEAYRAKILKVPGVKEVAVEDWFGGTYKDDRPEHMFARFATDPDKIFEVRTEIKIPEDQKQAFIHDRTGCVIGRGVAESQKFNVGDKFTIVGDIYPFNLELTVRGIFDADNNVDLIYFSREYLEQSLSESNRGNVGMFGIRADSVEDVPRIEKAVDTMFHNSPVQTKTETANAFSLSFVSFLGNIKLFLLIVCAAVMFTMLLVSANTIAMSVRERVREVGVLKVLGFTNGMILSIILTEALILSLLGGAIGVFLASLMTGIVRKGPAFLDQLKHLSMTPAVGGVCLLIAAGIGLLSAFIPAYQASRISILEALRSTD